MMQSVEECDQLRLEFDKIHQIALNSTPVIPVAVQDYHSHALLMIAYTDESAFHYTMEHKVIAFWSTSRNELWIKGKTSGHYLNLIEAYVNCEQNSLLYLARPQSDGMCHTQQKNSCHRHSCFYRKIQPDQTLKFCQGSE